MILKTLKIFLKIYLLIALPLFLAPALQAAKQAPSLPVLTRNAATSSNVLVKEVKVKGNKNTNKDIILSIIQTRPEEPLSNALITKDVKSVYSLGYFDDVSVDREDVAGGCIITFIVSEKPQIKEIKFVGNHDYQEKDLSEAIRMAVGQAYDEKVLSDTVVTLKQFYIDKSYNNIAVKADHKLSPDEGKVSVTFTISEGERIHIKKIAFKGNKIFSEGQLKGQMETQEAGWLGGGVYKEDVFKEDLDKITEFYHTEGYVKAKVVSHDVSMEPDGKSMDITITVEEGQQFKMGKITVSDNLVFTSSDIMDRVSFKEGDVFNTKKFSEDLRNVQELYGEKGYIYTSVNPLTEFHYDTNKVDVNLQVVEGPLAYIEDIRIEGNTRTKDKVIRRELLVQPGDIFDSIKVQRSREKVYNLGFFDEVNVDTEPGSERGKETLVLSVKERLTGTLSLGAGFSSVDGLLGFLEISENNLFGNAQRISLSTQFGQRALNYNIGFVEPWLFDTPTSLGLDIYDTQRTDLNSYYTETHIGGDIRLSRRWSDYYSSGITYRFEQINISDVSSLATNIIAGTNTVSSITLTQTYDSRDNVFDANRGIYTSLSNELAGGWLGGDTSFTKHVFDFSRYYPTIWNEALGLHLRLGYASGFGDTPEIPIYEAFFMGGTDTVRGYNERDIGPKNPYGVPLGGSVMALLNAEYKFPIVPNILKWIFFYDSGDTWTDVSSALSESLPYPDSLGTGFRVSIPGMVIVIRLDYGWALRAPMAVPGGKFHFNIGSMF